MTVNSPPYIDMNIIKQVPLSMNVLGHYICVSQVGTFFSIVYPSDGFFWVDFFLAKRHCSGLPDRVETVL